MRLYINAVAATRGGAVTHLQKVTPLIVEKRPDWEITIALPAPDHRSKLHETIGIENQTDVNIEFVPYTSALKRTVWENLQLPRRLGDFDVLFTPLNHGTYRAGIPQLLFVRNALYFTDSAPKTLRNTVAHKLRLLATRLAVAGSTHVIVPSNSMRTALLDHVSCEPAKVSVLYHGIDSVRLDPDESADWTDGIANFDSWRSHQVSILYVGSSADHKNLNRLTDAASKLRNDGVDLALGFTLDSEELKASVPSHPYSYALGRVPHQSMPALMGSAELVVCPSLVESFDQVFVQAQAWAQRVAASDIAVHRELNHSDAPLFDPTNTDDIAQVVRTSLANAPQVPRPTDRLLGWEHHVDALIFLLEDIGGNNP